MATNIPPHNLGEVVRAACHLIDDPEATPAQLLDRVKGPDFPLGGKVVTDRATLRKIYEDGTGSIKVQGEWKLEEEFAKAKTDYRDLHSLQRQQGRVGKGHRRHHSRAQIAATPGREKRIDPQGWHADRGWKSAADVDPALIMAYLYKHTALQENFAYNMTCLVPGSDGKVQPERLGLKEMLRHFLDFRFATVRTRFEYDLAQLRRRIHILEGFRIIFNDLDRAIKMIRESSGKADAAEKLIKTFKLDADQTAAILDAQLYKIAQMEIKKILDELKEKAAAAARIEAILGSDKKLWGVVRAELAEVGEKHGSRRRTKMGAADDAVEFDPEAYISRENTNVVGTKEGWIKRVGRLASVETTRVKEGDEVLAVVPASTLDHVILFADDGTAYTMRMNEVPPSSGYGEPITKYFKLADQVRILSAATTDERFTPLEQPGHNGDPPGPYLLVVTANGLTLRTPLTPFRMASNKPGRRFIRLEEGDKVVLAGVLNGRGEHLYLASAHRGT